MLALHSKQKVQTMGRTKKNILAVLALNALLILLPACRDSDNATRASVSNQFYKAQADQTKRADALLMQQEVLVRQATAEAEADLKKRDELMKRQEELIKRYEKILSTWERQQNEY